MFKIWIGRTRVFKCPTTIGICWAMKKWSSKGTDIMRWPTLAHATTKIPISLMIWLLLALNSRSSQPPGLLLRTWALTIESTPLTFCKTTRISLRRWWRSTSILILWWTTHQRRKWGQSNEELQKTVLDFYDINWYTSVKFQPIFLFFCILPSKCLKLYMVLCEKFLGFFKGILAWRSKILSKVWIIKSA